MANLSQDELSKREEIIQGMLKNKRTLVKRYIKDKKKKGEEPINPESVIYGRATKMAKKLKETKMEKVNLKELVRQALSKGYNPDQAQLYDEDEIFMPYDDEGRPLGLGEDMDLGHTDNEPHMLKADLYRIGKYAMELYQMVDEFEGKGEVDFPHWWQAKIINAREALVSAKHYLDFETKEPQIDAMVGAIDMSGALDNIGVEDKIEENLDARYAPSEDYKYVVNSQSVIGLKGREDKIYFRTEEAARAYVADKPETRKYLGIEGKIKEGIHDINITSAPHTNVKGEMKPYNPAERAASLARLAKFGPKKEDDKVDEKKLTKPELKKREEVAKSIEKNNPKMDREKKMAIASDIAKRVAERISAGK